MVGTFLEERMVLLTEINLEGMTDKSSLYLRSGHKSGGVCPSAGSRSFSGHGPTSSDGPRRGCSMRHMCVYVYFD